MLMTKKKFSIRLCRIFWIPTWILIKFHLMHGLIICLLFCVYWFLILHSLFSPIHAALFLEIFNKKLLNATRQALYARTLYQNNFQNFKISCKITYHLFLENTVQMHMAENIKQQEMSQSRDECPQRNWSSIRHI